MKKRLAGFLAVLMTFSAAASLPEKVFSGNFGMISASAETWSAVKNLNSDLTIDGSVETNSDIILNNHTLTVNGDLYMTAGMLDIGTGKLVVNGNLYIGKDSASSYAYIVMQNASSSITITGDLVWSVNSNMTNTLGDAPRYTTGLISAGTINVAGNVYDHISSTKNMNSFVMTGTSVLNLNGTGIQTMKGSYFGKIANLTITNNRTVDMEGYFYSKTALVSNLNIVTQKGLKISSMVIGGKTVNITGDVTQCEKDIDLGGGTLNITGNFTAQSGATKVNGGNLNVSGDYRIAYLYNSGKYDLTDAGLNMTNSNDVVTVGGDLIIWHRPESSRYFNKITAGKIYVDGDFDCKSDEIIFDSGNTIYMTGTGNHTVKLNHKKKIYNLVLTQDPSYYNSDIENYATNLTYDLDFHHNTDTETKPTYPTNIKVEYSEAYHQIRFTWDKVEGADKYGIAVYLAGKWRIQDQNITTTSYTTPKNLTPGKTYKVAIAARVNGNWDSANAIKNAVTVTVK